MRILTQKKPEYPGGLPTGAILESGRIGLGKKVAKGSGFPFPNVLTIFCPEARVPKPTPPIKQPTPYLRTQSMAKKPVVIAVFNHKGGSGKTTITFNTAAAFHRRGKRVLMVDLDSQANLTQAVGLQPRLHVGLLLTNSEESWFEWDEIVACGQDKQAGLDLLPGKSTLVATEQILGVSGSTYQLRELLENKPYDVVIVDCPPMMGNLTRCALDAADYYVVPLPAENFAWQGLDRLIKAAAKITTYSNPDLKLAGIIRNKYEMRTLFAKQMNVALKDSNLPVFKTIIRQNIALMESPAQQQSIFEYARPSNQAVVDMTNFVDELETIVFPEPQ